ncbi:helix-turn-helix domain-containing protein [Nocardia caishijiensis]|uniref:HTH cro/C1-type domain-containing protein n=1 Tax=Nocardia caishijiensis TaxID=184756 RepID=A0ABQ6YQF5_9NOCA|nr:helix-turn-helix transcriptional regulator [Nocardia caishijiensis]KAF0847790.1 hypothetical protein FNL39_103692 [Nocardia caishijiensis]
MHDEENEQKLSLAIVEALKNKGLSQSEIARQFNVTRQYVSWIKHTYGGRLTPTEKLLREHFPWKCPVVFSQAAPYQRLRNHGEFVATGGNGMAEYKLDRLRGFYGRLREGFVVEFDPDLPPERRVSNKGGWAYRERLPEDGDLLIRVNEHTNLTEEGARIWRLPLVDP